jgi:hypothetical protein
VEDGERDRGEVSAWGVCGEETAEGGRCGEDIVEGCIECFADEFDCGGCFG